MSGFFGIFNRNGNPVELDVVRRMLEANSFWEPDERNTWRTGPVALGHSMLWNTPESKYDHLPLKKRNCIITMDARIDNREELLNELELPDRPLEEIGDSEFILAAYDKWGEECPNHLLGDFAFAIWDEKRQQLFCTRDYIGIKPFYYYLDDKKIVFSNEIKVLLSHPEIDNQLNEEAMAYYLKHGSLSNLDMTFYENICKLHSATSLTVTANEEKKHTYWKAEECPQIRYKSLDEYICRTRELLEKAVEARIRSIYPIASHLSGGLDSSSIAVLASRKLAKSGRTLTGFNWIPVLDEDVNTDYYEWGNSKKIASLENIKHQAISLSENDILKLYKTLDITYGDTITFWYEHQIQKSAGKKDIRVILSGTGGDEFISNNSYGYIAGLFWKGELKRAYSVLRRNEVGSKHPNLATLKRFFTQVIRPSIPDWLYCMYNRTYCSSNKVSKYLKPAMAKSIKGLKTDNKLLKRIGIQNTMLNACNDGLIQTRIESWNVSGKLNKMEYRYPLLDKRIVEFALGIPENLFRQNGKGRFLFRRAIEGLLPQEIIYSDTKYEPKRVTNYMSTSQKAQRAWRQPYKTIDKNNKSFELAILFQDIDKYSFKKSFDDTEYEIIMAITNVILAMESCKKGHKHRNPNNK